MYCRMKSLMVGALASIVFVGLSVPAFAQIASGQKVETKGLILTRDGETMTVDTKDLGKVVVVLTETTEMKIPKGLFRHKDMEVTSLIPGLQIELEGKGDDKGQVVAEEIKFSEESLRVAKQVQAATEATRAQVETNKQGVASNAQTNTQQQQAIEASAAKIGVNAADIKEAQQRFDDLTQWDVKKEVTINFATGESTLPKDSESQLASLAQATKGLKGYLVEVKGFASTSGNAGRNQQLSEERAESVMDFLHKQGVPVKNLVNPAAMGTTNPVSSNETQEGRLQNQRVEVKLLVNRALAR